MEGICKCGNNLWKWKLIEHELTLTCTKCGQEAHFTIDFPMIDLLSDALQTNKEKGGKT